MHWASTAVTRSCTCWEHFCGKGLNRHFSLANGPGTCTAAAAVTAALSAMKWEKAKPPSTGAFASNA